ncbi:MAG: hypothetical protein QOJ00_2171 [Actinomycetota bacterium]|jgi:hypothetical protein
MTEFDPRVSSALEHVQKAALELIAAMRNALDVAEDLVADPSGLQNLVQGAAIAARAATETVAAATATATSAATAATAERVERIRVD